MKLPKTGLRKIWFKNDQYFLESRSEVNFIKLAEVRPTLELSRIRKHKRKNQVKLNRYRAKVWRTNWRPHL